MSHDTWGLSSLCRWFLPRAKPVRRAKAATAKPWLEALEDRLAPATLTHLYGLNGSLADQLGLTPNATAG